VDRTIRVIGFSMTAAFALASGIVAATLSTTQAERVLDAERAIEVAHDARADYQDSRYRLAATMDRLAVLGELEPVLPRLEGAAGVSALGRLTSALEAGRGASLAQSLSGPVLGPLGEIPEFDERMGLDAAQHVITVAVALTEEWAEADRRVTEVDRSFGAVVDEAESRLSSVQGTIPAAAKQVVAANGSATSKLQDAVRDAAASVAEGGGDPVAELSGYADAVDALRASHAAEQARIAAEAAAAAESASRPRSSGSSGSSGSGGSNSGGGSSGGGSGGGGGGSNPEPDTRRHVDARGAYTPGCRLGPLLDRHDPGPGGTSIITKTIPYDYRIEGNWVAVYACSW